MSTPHTPSAPRSCYPTDLPLAELRTTELFTVALLRLWVLRHREPGGAHPDWRGGFAAARLDPQGMAAFDALFRVVAATARRSLDVRCQQCLHLGADEAWLLRLVSLLQHGRDAAAQAVLEQWLPPTAARFALLPARGFASALAAAAMTVPLRHAEAAGTHLTYATCPDRGFSLVQ